MKMNFDFSNAKENTGLKFIPAGKHTVKIKGVESKTTTNGHPQLIITFEDKEGRTFDHYQLANTEHEWVVNWFYNFAKNAGLNVEKGQFSLDTNELIGKPLFVDIKREYNDYSDKYRNNLKYTAAYDKEKVDQWNEEYPITDEEKAHKAKQDGNQQGGSNNSNPFSSTDGPVDISDSDLPF